MKILEYYFRRGCFPPNDWWLAPDLNGHLFPEPQANKENETKMSHNGWENRETWAVNLWTTNDEGSEAYLRELAEEAWRGADSNDEAHETLAASIQEWIEGDDPTQPGTLYGDLMASALQSVDWDEIADAALEGYDPSEFDTEVDESEEE